MATTSYLIQIGSSYLTKTGGVGGLRCKSIVSGVDALQFTYLENHFNDMNGNPIALQTNVGVKGKPIEIEVFALPASVATTITGIITTAQAAQSTINLIGTSADTPNFSLTVIPGSPAYSFRDFTGYGTYLNSTFRFIATGVYTP